MVGFSSNLLLPPAGSSWGTEPTTKHSVHPQRHLAASFVALLYTGSFLRGCLEASFLLMSQCEAAAAGLCLQSGTGLVPARAGGPCWGAPGVRPCRVSARGGVTVLCPCRGELPHRHGHDRHGAGLQQPQQRRGGHGRHHEPAGGRRGAGRPRGLQRPALAPVNHPAPHSQVHLPVELCSLWNSWDWEAFMWELHKSCVRTWLILPCVTSDKVE